MSMEHERNETPLEEAQRKWGEVTYAHSLVRASQDAGAELKDRKRAK